MKLSVKETLIKSLGKLRWNGTWFSVSTMKGLLHWHR